MMRALAILLTYLLLVGAAPVCAQQDLLSQVPPTISGEKKPKWEGAEKFVWDMAQDGKDANLDDYCKKKPPEGVDVAGLSDEWEKVVRPYEWEKDPDPSFNDFHWEEQCRVISAAFIEDILTKKEWRDKLASQGLRVSGASVTEPLDLTAAHIIPGVWLKRSRFKKEVKLNWARFDGVLSFKDSTFDHGIEAEALQVKGVLNLSHATVLDKVMKLWMAKIDGNLDMGAAFFTHGIEAVGLHVGGSLYLGSKAEVGLMYGHGLLLTGATIDGDFHMSNSTFSGPVLADSVRVGGNLYLYQATLTQKKTTINTPEMVIPEMPMFQDAHIAGSFDLSEAKLPGLDLTGAVIGGTLLLVSPKWSKDAQLILRNTHVSILQEGIKQTVTR
jgi:hypothetical protein